MKDSGDKLFCVYMHTSPSGKRYIGITSKKPEERWNHGKAYYQNKYFTRAIEKYGWDNFEHRVLFHDISRADACKKEKELIAKYQSNNALYGYNLSAGGENPAAGCVQSQEAIKKRVMAIKGRKRGPCKAISDAKKGRSNGHEGMNGINAMQSGLLYQIDEETKEVVNLFYGFCEMSRKTGFAKTPVRECAYGIRKRAYGYLWEYKKRGINNVAI